MGRLVVISNRGALTFSKDSGVIDATPSVSGLVSAIDPIMRKEGGAWIAWGGRYGPEGKNIGDSMPILGGENCTFYEVLLTPREEELYYGGMANSCLWPLCHSFIEKSVFNQQFWDTYLEVNKKYADVYFQVADLEDLIWIQDYHLALVPGYIRRRKKQAKLAIFWHVPFPPAEIFSILPWAGEILKGLLESDLIGFHIEDYVNNFLHSAKEILGAKVDYLKGTVQWNGRQVKIKAIPIGIDWVTMSTIAKDENILAKAREIRKKTGVKHLLLGVDRLDYTKGIPERLCAIEWLLDNFPQYRNILTLVQIAVPCRTEVPAYQTLKKKVESQVLRINKKFSQGRYKPVIYLNQSFNKVELAAYYKAADMALVTPLKDGLNLVAKEYVASKAGDDGVLLLSPFAGAAAHLKGAMLANPYDLKTMANQIIKGLQMTSAAKKEKMAYLLKIVQEEDINWWWQEVQHYWFTGWGGVGNESRRNGGTLPSTPEVTVDAGF